VQMYFTVDVYLHSLQIVSILMYFMQII